MYALYVVYPPLYSLLCTWVCMYAVCCVLYLLARPYSTQIRSVTCSSLGIDPTLSSARKNNILT